MDYTFVLIAEEIWSLPHIAATDAVSVSNNPYGLRGFSEAEFLNCAANLKTVICDFGPEK